MALIYTSVDDLAGMAGKNVPVTDSVLASQLERALETAERLFEDHCRVTFKPVDGERVVTPEFPSRDLYIPLAASVTGVKFLDDDTDVDWSWVAVPSKNSRNPTQLRRLRKAEGVWGNCSYKLVGTWGHAEVPSLAKEGMVIEAFRRYQARVAPRTGQGASVAQGVAPDVSRNHLWELAAVQIADRFREPEAMII